MFLVAVISTAETGKKTFQEILVLRNEVESKVVSMGRRAKNAQKLLNVLYRRPVLNSAGVMKELGISQVAADQLLKEFLKVGIVKEMTGFKRNKLFQFSRYFNLFLK